MRGGLPERISSGIGAGRRGEGGWRPRKLGPVRGRGDPPAHAGVTALALRPLGFSRLGDSAKRPLGRRQDKEYTF